MLTLFIVGVFLFGGLFGVWFAQPRYVPPTMEVEEYPTGKDVLAELQKYRVSEGLPEFEVSSVLCDNIGERWQNYVKNNSHEGFSEFAQREYPPGMDVAEILVAGDSAKQMVEKWVASPSHDLYIHNYSKICVYSDSGSTVAILSN
jgi:hypothetical protein